MNRTLLKVAAVAAVQLALVGAAVAPRLSARVTGEEYRLRVAPVDPIDPFRGAYVDLDYPDLRTEEAPAGNGPLYVSLVRDGDVWTAGTVSRTRPSGTPYLACDDRDWRVRCGIESWFLPQDEAAGLQDRLGDGGLVAVVKVDGRGHAALVRVEAGAGS
ncbi:MAG: GDYXXLXY domain-containing protein [Nocardioides sp.]